MKFLDLFAGIGGFRSGMEANGFEPVGFVEYDKYARKSYEAVYDTEGEWTREDITQVSDEDWEELKGEVDIITGGFPCQAFSVAGKRGGFDDARGTLFFEIARAATIIKPKVLFMENVKGLVSHDKGKTLDTIFKTLNDIGYRVDFDILNSKHFGVPQNRERIMIVAVREDLIPNEDWDIKGTNVIAKGKKRINQYEGIKTFNFKYPQNNTVDTRLKDVLSDQVDEKFYLGEEQTSKLTFNMQNKEKEEDQIKVLGHRKGYRRNTQVFAKDGITETLDTGTGGGRGHYTLEEDPGVNVIGNTSENGHGSKRVYDTEGVSPTLQARDYKGAKQILEKRSGEIINPLKGMTDNGWHFEQAVYDDEGITRTVKAGGGSGNIPKVIENTEPLVGASRGRYDDSGKAIQRLEVNEEGVSNTITSVQKDNYLLEPSNEELLRIKEATKKGYAEARVGDSVDCAVPTSKTRRGRVGKGMTNTIDTTHQQGVVVKDNFGRMGKQAEETYNTNEVDYGNTINPYNRTVDHSGTAPTLTTRPEGFKTAILPVTQDLRIRKLTPQECWRLQGFTDEQFDKAQEVNSNSQLYKQAGNAVTVNVIKAVGKGIKDLLEGIENQEQNV